MNIEAINNRDLLAEVVKIKKTFYDTGYANYDDCLIGKFNIIPRDACLSHLKHDFNKMLSNKMFYGEQPDFESIISKIEQLQKKINVI